MSAPQAISGRGRTFLLLQGPHGPFFARLARALEASGATCWRVGFNAGDRLFGGRRDRFIPYRRDLADWPDALARLAFEKRITDLVLYGDTRPVHAAAVRLCRERDIRLHVFEEGYLRPYWVTYERGGSNGHSRLAALSIAEMARRLGPEETAPRAAPPHWGDMREHVFYGAVYHAAVMAGARPTVPTHRDIPIAREFRLYLRRLLLMPAHAAERFATTRRVLAGGYPFHLALLQLDHDASFRAWSPFRSNTELIETVIAGFAKGAPPHHHLVFKAHPLEDGRAPLRRTVRRIAREHGLSDRVHFILGGRLARLLDAASTAVTANSTAAQQALWRGLPVLCLGVSVYAKPELVSRQPLAEFYASPTPPDPAAYATYRRFLLDTSQVPGGYYAAKGRRQLLRSIVDRMLDAADPYERRRPGDAAEAQQSPAIDRSSRF